MTVYWQQLQWYFHYDDAQYAYCHRTHIQALARDTSSSWSYPQCRKYCCVSASSMDVCVCCDQGFCPSSKQSAQFWGKSCVCHDILSMTHQHVICPKSKHEQKETFCQCHGRPWCRKAMIQRYARQKRPHRPMTTQQTSDRTDVFAPCQSTAGSCG